MNVFDIILKEDTAERLAKVQTLDPKYVLFAPEFNAVVAALKKLIPKGQYRDNYDAYAAGLDDGDIYYLPAVENRNILAVYKAPLFISLIDSNRDQFENIEEARAFVMHYTDAVPQLETYENYTYKFSVPPNTAFDKNSGFLSSIEGSQHITFIDEGGAVNLFGDSAFFENTQNNVLGDCTLGMKAFKGTTGNNKLGNIISDNALFAEATGENIFKNVEASGEAFIKSTGIFRLINLSLTGEANFRQANGIYYFGGNLGTTESDDFPHDFFYDSHGTVHALSYKQTSNAENVEGDLARAIHQGVNVIFDL